MNPDFICKTFADPKGESSAFARIVTGNYKSTCYIALAKGKEHAKAIDLIATAWEATEGKSYSFYPRREHEVWDFVEPQLPEGVQCCFFHTDLDNTKYKEIWLHGYENSGGEFHADMPLASLAINYLSLDGIPNAEPILGDNHCSHDENEMFVFCAAPFKADDQGKAMKQAARDAFTAMCRPVPEYGWEEAEAFVRTVFPDGCMVLAMDKGLAMDKVDWEALPQKSLPGELHIRYHSSETDLYGKDKGSHESKSTAPIKTGELLPTAGITARIVDIPSPDEVLILADRKIYSLKRGEKITLSTSYDGYEDHEGVVWSTTELNYIIKFP